MVIVTRRERSHSLGHETFKVQHFNAQWIRCGVTPVHIVHVHKAEGLLPEGLVSSLMPQERRTWRVWPCPHRKQAPTSPGTLF